MAELIIIIGIVALIFLTAASVAALIERLMK